MLSSADMSYSITAKGFYAVFFIYVIITDQYIFALFMREDKINERDRKSVL